MAVVVLAVVLAAAIIDEIASSGVRLLPPQASVVEPQRQRSVSFLPALRPGERGCAIGNPPTGYSDPFDQGTITLISPTLAQYRSHAGIVTQWSRHAGARIASPCS